jgi:hypothetical protein
MKSAAIISDNVCSLFEAVAIPGPSSADPHLASFGVSLRPVLFHCATLCLSKVLHSENGPALALPPAWFVSCRAARHFGRQAPSMGNSHRWVYLPDDHTPRLLAVDW